MSHFWYFPTHLLRTLSPVANFPWLAPVHLLSLSPVVTHPVSNRACCFASTDCPVLASLVLSIVLYLVVALRSFAPGGLFYFCFSSRQDYFLLSSPQLLLAARTSILTASELSPFGQFSSFSLTGATSLYWNLTGQIIPRGLFCSHWCLGPFTSLLPHWFQ